MYLSMGSVFPDDHDSLTLVAVTSEILKSFGGLGNAENTKDK